MDNKTSNVINNGITVKNSDLFKPTSVKRKAGEYIKTFQMKKYS